MRSRREFLKTAAAFGLAPVALLGATRTDLAVAQQAFATSRGATSSWAATVSNNRLLAAAVDDLSTTWMTDNSRGTVTANATASPDGTATADKLGKANNAETRAYRYLLSQPTGTSNQTQVFSCYAKAAERAWFKLTQEDIGGTGVSAWFNCSTGAVGTVQGTGATGMAVAVGNGWYLCRYKLPLASGSNPNQIVSVEVTNSDGTADVNGWATDEGMYFWHFRLEIWD